MIQMIVVGTLQHSVLVMKTFYMMKHGTGHHLQCHTNLRVCSRAGQLQHLEPWQGRGAGQVSGRKFWLKLCLGSVC
jgi:hypothetical protein